jgi:peptidoglycan/xylan/chitin deacetylase (PgdA/CDA1 family)
LKEKNLLATFFCVGENVVRYPEIYQRIIDEGHAVGNHTMKHLNAIKVKPKDYLQSIEDAQKVIHSKLFRPPYGRLTPTLAKKIRSKYVIIMWSWLSYDFDQDITIEKILEKAKKQVKGGDILVLHDNPKITEKQKILLPALIEQLSEKKFIYKILKTD